MLRSFLITFLLSVAAILPLKSQEVLFRKVSDTKSDTYIEVSSLFSDISNGGYHPVRVVVQNNLAIPQRIFLNFKSGTGYGDGISTSSEFSFLVKPLQAATSDILVPLAPQNSSGYNYSLVVDMSGTMGRQSSTERSGFNNNSPSVLLSERLHRVNASAFDTEAEKRSSSSRGGSTNFSSRFDPSQLPSDWRAYSGYDAMMLTGDEWTSIPPGPRTAITTWLRQGGKLVVFSSGIFNRTTLQLPEDSSFGQIILRRISKDLRLNAKSTTNIVLSKKKLSQTRLRSITEDFERSWPLQKEFGEKSFNYIVFLMILVIFGIIVGPINLFVFAKSGRRHRLFVTTPIISFVTSLILITLILFQDGFGGKGTRLILMEVRPDDSQNAAYLHQEQFARTGVITSPSFTMEDSALISPVVIDETRWSRFTDNYKTSGSYGNQPLGNKSNLSGGWFQSRSEQGQLITAMVPTRGKIEVRSEDTFASTFDFPIEKLLFRNADGDWFEATEIKTGKPFRLKKLTKVNAQKFINETADRFTARNKRFFKKVSERKECFIALSKDAPGISTHPGIDWETTALITGPISR